MTKKNLPWDFEKFPRSLYFPLLLLVYFYWLWAGQSYFTSLGKMLCREKQSKSSRFDKKLKNHA